MSAEEASLQIAYDRRAFDAAPPIYRDTLFVGLIRDAAGLSETSADVRVLDLMSGPGKLAGELKKSAPALYFCLDFAGSQLQKIPSETSNLRMLADVQALPIAPETFDVVVVRFGIKDLIASSQPDVIAGIYRILKPGGRLIVADMVAPEGAGEWLNAQHALKQELGGRNPQIEGKCHIPSETDWIDLLIRAGFQPDIFGKSVSYVNTSDWEKSKQVTAEQLVQLNQMIGDVPETIREAFNIRQEADGLKIDYPLVVLRAIKPLSVSTDVK